MAHFNDISVEESEFVGFVIREHLRLSGADHVEELDPEYILTADSVIDALDPLDPDDHDFMVGLMAKGIVVLNEDDKHIISDEFCIWADLNAPYLLQI
jgi:hypothetical protein